MPYPYRVYLSFSVIALILPSLSAARALQLEELLEMDIVDLAQVQIEVASRRLESIAGAPSVINVVSAKEIESFGANNLLDILNRVPSVQAIGSHFYAHSVSMRGQMVSHSNNDVLFLINGRPHRTSWNGGTPERLLKAFPIETIDRIEIIRGPGSVLYGTGAFSGVINIITKNGEKQTDAYALTVGSRHDSGGDTQAPFSSRGAHLTGGYESDGVQVAGGVKVFDSDGWTFTATDESGETQNVARGETDTGMMLTAAKGGLSTSVLYTDVRLDNIMGEGVLWPAGAHETKHLLFDTGYEKRIGSVWSWDNHLTYNKFDFSYESSPPQKNVRDSDDILLESTLTGELSRRLNVLAGVNYESINGTISPTFDYASFRYSVFAQADYAPVEYLKMTAGFQWNKVQRTDSDLSPRLGLVASFSPRWGGKLLYGEAFRSAVATERFLPPDNTTVGNESLEPEKIATSELQLFYTSQYTFTAFTYFHSKMSDVIDRISIGGGQFRFENVGTVQSKGVELETKSTLRERWTLSGSATYQQNEDGDGFDATLAPAWMAKLGIAYRYNHGLDFGIYDGYFSASTAVAEVNPLVREVNPEPEAYHYLTANFNLDISKYFSRWDTPPMILSLYGDNLLGEKVAYAEFNRRRINSIPLYSGRALYATVKVLL